MANIQTLNPSHPAYGDYADFVRLFNGLSYDNTGHIITAERVGDIVRFYDPQNGKIIKNIESYLKNVDYFEGIEVLYVSDLRINPEMAKKVI